MAEPAQHAAPANVAHGGPPRVLHPPSHLPGPDADDPNFALLPYLADDFIDKLSKEQARRWHHGRDSSFKKTASLPEMHASLKQERDLMQSCLRGMYSMSEWEGEYTL